MTTTGQDQLIKNILNSININEGDLKYSIGDQVFGFFSAVSRKEVEIQ
jgi:hypothetical protein